MPNRRFGDPKAFLRELFSIAVASAQAGENLAKHFPKPPHGRLIVVGAGKAAAAMALAAERHYDGHVEGIVIVPDGYALPCAQIQVVEASHPVPDHRGADGARRIVELVQQARAEDLVLCLLSGGASAVMVAPADGVSLDDKRAITDALLRNGAAIAEINCARKHLSAVKGGRLAVSAAPADVVCLIISDVVGDDPSVIGSGPTVADPSTCAEALDILHSYMVAVPEPVQTLLSEGRLETPKQLPSNVSATVVIRPRDALIAVADYARSLGINVLDLGDACDGDAQLAARAQAHIARSVLGRMGETDPPCLILSGGELTVKVMGAGRGGPNTEFCLALAEALDGAESIWALAADTDGSDGNAGAAGAVIGPLTLRRLRSADIDVTATLKCNDSARALADIGDLVDSGPTYTNINDFRAILVCPRAR